MEKNYQFISKNSPSVQCAYKDLQDILNQVHQCLCEYTFHHRPVGSYSRNMITYDLNSNVGFDFDINIFPHDEDNYFSPKEIKLLFKKALDRVVLHYGYDFAEDSTRVLTIKFKDREYSRILHSVDFAFVNDYTDDEGNDCLEYIRFNKRQNSYFWTDQPQVYQKFHDRVQQLKENDLWQELREVYIYKKNHNDNPHKHSCSLYAEAVHEVYNQNFYC